MNCSVVLNNLVIFNLPLNLDFSKDWIQCQCFVQCVTFYQWSLKNIPQVDSFQWRLLLNPIALYSTATLPLFTIGLYLAQMLTLVPLYWNNDKIMDCSVLFNNLVFFNPPLNLDFPKYWIQCQCFVQCISFY